MSEAELLGRVAAYLLSCHALGLGSWALADLALPAAARAGLRLLAVISGQMALTAILVQTLGLAGLLNAPAYLAASLAVGAAALVLRRVRRPHREYCRLLWRGFRLWAAAPRAALGWLTCLVLLGLAGRLLALPQDIDALSLHGPLIVEWVQSGRVALASHWNYPQGWEYQQVPGFLLLRSDLLAVVPALAGVAALLLALREIAARLRLPGYAAHLLAVLGSTIAVVWRDPFKNDTVFAAALLLAALAVERQARGTRGGFWLAQLAVFLILATKPSGFLYAALLGLLFLLASLAARRRRGPTPVTSFARGLAITLVMQVSAAAVQLRNLIESGNPVLPMRFAPAGVEIFPGPFDLSGTSILDHAGQLETWRQFLLGGRIGVGAEWPLLLGLLAAATLLSLAKARRNGAPASGAETLARLLPFAALALWALFTATPWSCGLRQGSWDYLANGSSLRYAIAPIGLTYLTAAVALRRWLGNRRLTLLLAFAVPLLVGWKWSRAGLAGSRDLLPAALALLGLVLLLALAVRLAGSARGRRGAAAVVAAGAVLVACLYVRRLEAAREEFWLPAYREVWQAAWQAPAGSRIGVNLPRRHFRYALYGPSFDHRLLHIALGRGRGGQIPEDVGLLYVVPPEGGAELAEIVAAMETRGWKVAARSGDGGSVLLARSP